MPGGYLGHSSFAREPAVGFWETVTQMPVSANPGHDIFGGLGVRRGWLTAAQIDEGLDLLRREGVAAPSPRLLGEILVSRGRLTRERLEELLKPGPEPDAPPEEPHLFGDILLERHPDAKADLQEALRRQEELKKAGKPPTPIGEILQELQALGRHEVQAILAEQRRRRRTALRLAVEARECDGILILRLKGGLDFASSVEIERHLQPRLTRPPLRCVVDCAALEFMNSHGVSLFVRSIDAIRAGGGDLKFCGLRDEPLEVMNRLGLDRFFQIHPDAKTAEKAFGVKSAK